MVSEGKGRLFKRKDGKYMVYVPVSLAEDSMFPFKDYKKTKSGTDALPVRVYFKQGEEMLYVEKWS